MITKVTKRSVDMLSCPSNKDRVYIWDSELKGFGACCNLNGHKTFCIRYRSSDRKQHTVKIGAYGLMTPDEARREAQQKLAANAIGRKVTIIRSAPTFGEIAEAYMIHHAEKVLKPATLQSYRSMLRLYILPKLGAVKLPYLDLDVIKQFHREVGSIKANRCLELISAVWERAAFNRTEEYYRFNPTHGVTKTPERKRQRYLSREELEALGAALAKAEAGQLFYEVDEKHPNAKHFAKPENRIRRVDPYAIAALRLLIMTGARLSEIREAKWSRIDLERLTVDVPDGKTGWLVVYLTEAAREILKSLPRIEGNDYVIVGDKPGCPRADLKRPWNAVRAEAGLKDMTIHGLRHSFASFALEQNISLLVLGKLLNHKSPQTTDRYAHLARSAGVAGVSLVGEIVTPRICLPRSSA